MKSNQALKAKKGKPGRKASGLRDLTPDEARYAVSKAMLGAVLDAKAFKAQVAKIPGLVDGLPSLDRLLRADLQIVSVLVADDGDVALQPALRSTAYEKQLANAGVPSELVFVAKAFIADVEGATVGKLTSSYGEGLGGGSAAEPERLVVAMDRLLKAQRQLNRGERFAVWSALVFGLPLADIGWALYGGRFGTHTDRLCCAAGLVLEAALERMQPWYLARA